MTPGDASGDAGADADAGAGTAESPTPDGGDTGDAEGGTTDAGDAGAEDRAGTAGADTAGSDAGADANPTPDGEGEGPPSVVDGTFETVVGLVDDEYARAILAETSVEPLSAAEIGERCGMSRATAYRRIERLREADLVDERTRPRPDGHHDTVYAATLDRLTVTLEDGEFGFDLERTEDRTEDAVDRLTRMWEDL